jgi:hypothetical protein
MSLCSGTSADPFIQLFGTRERRLATLLQSGASLIKEREDVRGHEAGIVLIQFENTISLLDRHPLKDVPFLDPPGDLCFDILRTFGGGIGGKLSADRNRLGPGYEGKDQEKQQQKGDGKA